MKEVDLDQFFPGDQKFTNPQQTFFSLLKKMNFYSPLLIDAFLLDTDPNTIVAKRGRFYRGDEYYAVGGKIMDQSSGYMILQGDISSELRLRLVAWKPWKDTAKEDFGEVLFNDRAPHGYHGRVIFSSNGRKFTGVERFGESREAEVMSTLSIEYYPERWNLLPIDPSNTQQSFDWWIIRKFLPQFLERRAAPLARVPIEEMKGWTRISNDPS